MSYVTGQTYYPRSLAGAGMTLASLKNERDQIIWDWRKGRYNTVKRDILLASVEQDIARRRGIS